MPVCVFVSAPAASMIFETPKSMSFGTNSPFGPRERKMFSGLMSRCTIP